MPKSSESSNPLALAVLVLLFERPMHPYEIAATLRARHKEKSIKLKYGSLYTVVEQLQRDGLIVPRETVKEGRRPERTIYAPTDSGLARMRAWLGELLAMPSKEFPRFEAGLSLIAALPPAEALTLLKQRGETLGQLSEEMQAGYEIALKMGVEPLYLVEAEFRREMLLAECDFVAMLIERIETDRGYTRVWSEFHEQKRPGGGESSSETTT